MPDKPSAGAALAGPMLTNPAIVPVAALLVAAATVSIPVFGGPLNDVAMDVIFLLPFGAGAVFIASVVRGYSRGFISGGLLLLVSPVIFAAVLLSAISLSMQSIL